METIGCAVAGHRPTRFKFKYNEDYSLCKKIKKAMLEEFRLLHDKYYVNQYYVGGALGVDMWAGELILRLKKEAGYQDIELHMVLPFEGHDVKWDARSRNRLEFLCRHSKTCTIAGKSDCRESYLKRNDFMLERAEYLVAVYDNSEAASSGSMQIVSHARKKGRKLCLIHPDTAKVSREY